MYPVFAIAERRKILQLEYEINCFNRCEQEELELHFYDFLFLIVLNCSEYSLLSTGVYGGDFVKDGQVKN